MKRIGTFLFCLLSLSANLLAQPGNDDCDSIVETELVFIETEVVIETPDEVDCETPCISLNAANSPTVENGTFEWTAINGGEIEDGQGTLIPTICGAGEYALNITQTINDLTCTGTNTITVIESTTTTCKYQIPNAFTPDGDGVNDVFQLIDDGGFNEVLSLTIYNRWGQKVHEGRGDSHAWNGMGNNKLAPSDVYVYIFKIRNSIGEEISESGDLTLIR